MFSERSKLKKYIAETLGEAEFVGDYETRSPEWHALRKQGIGGSEIGTILGFNPYESAYTLWHKKLELIPESDLSNNDSVWAGVVLEQPILDRFAEKHPELELFTTGTWRNKTYKFMHANPDALYRHRETGEWGVIEVKTGKNPWDSVPPAYRAQTMWYLHAFGLQKAYIVGFVGYRWEERKIEYDAFEGDHLVNLASKFVTALESESKPEWDGSDNTYETVRQMHPDIDGAEVEVGEIGINLWNAQMRLDEAQKELNAYKSAVLDYMGKARHATTTVDGEGTFRIASRQSRKDGLPYLVVKK